MEGRAEIDPGLAAAGGLGVVAVGLALIVALYRKRQTAHVEDLTTMKYWA